MLHLICGTPEPQVHFKLFIRLSRFIIFIFLCSLGIYVEEYSLQKSDSVSFAPPLTTWLSPSVNQQLLVSVD